MSSSREELAQAIYDVSNLKGEFLLRSGVTSPEYFDKYLFEAQPALLKKIAQAMKALVPADTDALAGLEMGGIPLAVMLGQETGLPCLFVRKHAKEYGTCKIAEGGAVNGRRITMIEDVVTSGGAVMDAAKALRAEGADLHRVLCVIDREASGKAQLAELGLELSALFTMTDLKAHLSNET
jgi:orotate phosphoribosyltransferase